MKFLKRILSTVIGIFVFIFICFFSLFIFGVIQQSISSTDKTPNNSVLKVQLDFPLLDNAGKIRYKNLPFLDEDNKNGLFDLVNAIDYAAKDDHIKGISIVKPSTQAGITQLKTLREALARFKKSGKFVTAYSDIYSQKDYYLSSIADTIYISPVGRLDFSGLSTELLYFKDFQEKSGIKMDVVRIGKYKSAVEPFMNNQISDANKEQILSYLNSIWHSLRVEIGESRDLAPERLDTIADRLLARTPEKAKEAGLADQLLYRRAYKDKIKQAVDLEKDDDLSQISLVDYAKKIAPQNAYQHQADKVAVIYAQGKIIYGHGTVEKIGPEVLNKSIRKASEDDHVKAIVLRINSPGGSALASDLIWKAIDYAKKEKPVIVSMGDMAASGGYYIASGANQIFAEPTTITGSIGVFGLLPNIKGLTDKIGIHSQQVSTNTNAIAYSPFKDMSESQKKFIQESITDTYQLFKKRVATGRALSLSQVEEIAQGRVWTGKQGVENGLVDELGGLDDALSYAAEQADIDDYQIKEYPVFHKDLTKLLDQYGLRVSAEEMTKEILGEELYPTYKDFKNKTETKGIQLLFPYSTEIK